MSRRRVSPPGAYARQVLVDFFDDILRARVGVGEGYGSSTELTAFWRALTPEQRRRVNALGQAERRANAAHEAASRALRGGR